MERDGRKLLSFSCNDYLNLSHHPEVKAAAIDAVQRYGAGAGASRLVTGDHPLFEILEGRLAELKGAQAACVFGSGYLANAGIIPTFVGAGDLILAEDLAHACIWAGAKAFGRPDGRPSATTTWATWLPAWRSIAAARAAPLSPPTVCSPWMATSRRSRGSRRFARRTTPG